ncbi:MAG TPA: SpoIIE family protein phosphatase [Dongiaceae bacterium]|nr:SpoIIE family protein phosphatase [Dongiaceae bacterium]
MFSPLLSKTDAPQIVEPVPTVFPTIAGADIAAVFLGKRVAGDFYDSIRVNSERVLFGLLDVAGRREETRALLISAQEVFREVGAQLFAPTDINESDAMTELCLRINRRLIEVCCGVHSCPAFVACYHERFGTLCYSNAGHTPALLRDQQGITELGSTGLPLGLFSHATSDAPTVGMAPADSVLLVSRGVIDCEGNGKKDFGAFGLERVKEVFQTTSTKTALELCSSTLQAVSVHAGNRLASDDRTALALLRTG